MADEISHEAVLKVMVVDDHPVVREGLAGMLRQAGYLVFEAGDGRQAVDLASSVRPQLVIMDVLMPGISGIEATERICAQNPAIRVLMLSVADSPEIVRAALRAGATSYLTKAAASKATLLDAVRRTSDGETVFAPAGLVNGLVQASTRPVQPITWLSLREREIVALVAQGMTNAAIAAALALSPRTVENHLARIFKKLGTSSRSQLARVAIDHQLDRYPWSGQHCTIMLAEIAGFGASSRDDDDQLTLRRVMYDVLKSTFTRVSIPWSACHQQDRGDGIIIIVPPGVPTSSLIDPLLAILADGLKEHNRWASGPTSIQLHVALHAGPVASDAGGVSGQAIIHATRLAHAPILKQRIAETEADIGVIISSYVYDSVINRGLERVARADFDRVRIHVKESEITAWMWRGGGRRRIGENKIALVSISPDAAARVGSAVAAPSSIVAETAGRSVLAAKAAAAVVLTRAATSDPGMKAALEMTTASWEEGEQAADAWQEAVLAVAARNARIAAMQARMRKVRRGGHGGADVNLPDPCSPAARALPELAAWCANADLRLAEAEKALAAQIAERALQRLSQLRDAKLVPAAAALAGRHAALAAKGTPGTEGKQDVGDGTAAGGGATDDARAQISTTIDRVLSRLPRDIDGEDYAKVLEAAAEASDARSAQVARVWLDEMWSRLTARSFQQRPSRHIRILAVVSRT